MPDYEKFFSDPIRMYSDRWPEAVVSAGLARDYVLERDPTLSPSLGSPWTVFNSEELARIIPGPKLLAESDRRALLLLLNTERAFAAAVYLSKWLPKEGKDDLTSTLLDEVKKQHASDEYLQKMLAFWNGRVETKKPTSLHRLISSLPDDKIMRMYDLYLTEDLAKPLDSRKLVQTLVDVAPARLENLADHFLARAPASELGRIAQILLHTDLVKFELTIVRRYRSNAPDDIVRLNVRSIEKIFGSLPDFDYLHKSYTLYDDARLIDLGLALATYYKEKYGAEILANIPVTIMPRYLGPLLKIYREGALEFVNRWLNAGVNDYGRQTAIKCLGEYVGEPGMPIYRSLVGTDPISTKLALEQIRKFTSSD